MGARRMTLEIAEATAFRALAFIAGDEERLSRFMAETGLMPDSLRAAAASPGFAAAVMAHVMGDEDLLLAFAAADGIRPEAVAGAAHLLSPAVGDFEA
jgi:hypothetical protein